MNSIPRNNNNKNNKGKGKSKAKRQSSIKQWCSNSQTQEERIRIRTGYRALHDETLNERVNLIDPNSNLFGKFMKRQEDLYQKVQEPTEAIMDINQSAKMSEMLKMEANKLANQNFTITIQQFIRCVKNEYCDNESLLETDEILHGTPILWAKFGKLALLDFIQTAPSMSGLNSISIQNAWEMDEKEEKNKEKEKEKEKEKQKAQEDGQLLLDKEKEKEKARLKRKNKWIVTTEEKQAKVITVENARNNLNQTETKTRIASLNRFLRQECGISKKDNTINKGYPIDLWSFIINPQSYSETIENLFDLSFIVHQGNAMMLQPGAVDTSENKDKDNDNDNDNDSGSMHTQPLIKYMTEKQQKENKHFPNAQCIVKMDFNTFSGAVDYFDITQSQIQRKQNGNKKQRGGVYENDDINDNDGDYKDMESDSEQHIGGDDNGKRELDDESDSD